MSSVSQLFPRCLADDVPFTGPMGLVWRLRGVRRSDANRRPGTGLAITQRRNAASERNGRESQGLGWLAWRRIGVLRRFGGIVHVNPR